MADDSEAFDLSLPRDPEHMDGRNFTIEAAADESFVIISDGERSAVYTFRLGESLDFSKLRVQPAYIEAGAFCEAHVVTLTDGVGSAIYVPARKSV